jgi:hypothetical protein
MKTHQPGATIERSKNMKYILLMNGTKANFAEYAKSSEPLDALSEDPRLAEHRRLNAVRAHLLELAGDCRAARLHDSRASPQRNNPIKKFVVDAGLRSVRLVYFLHRAGVAGIMRPTRDATVEGQQGLRSREIGLSLS